ncbi:MAG: tryptophan--tRNA ligase [Spiroplasmataceae bacterium]|jgi:tryptophanyl-tRNA synthetase|nr:tryptophan--tRNA ligase [Spiroplasmataceae bacterium]
MNINKPKPRFFTGIQPTGTLTLGHYFGVIRHILAIQEEYEIIIMVCDLHALTITKKHFDYQKTRQEIAALLYACGLKEDCKIYFQSQIKEHLELNWLISPFATISELSNMIQYKEKKKDQETGNLAILSYPVLMAADIFLYDVDLIIVGQDQKQHLELATNIAQKFNNFYEKDLLKIPQFTIPKFGAKIMGLKNPQKKMSKSEQDFIALLDNFEVIKKKIKTAETDSEKKIYYDPEKKPGISNLLTIYALLNNKGIKESEEELEKEKINYSQFKSKIIVLLSEKLEEIQKKYQYYLSRVEEITQKNTDYLKILANKKIEAIKKELKI